MGLLAGATTFRPIRGLERTAAHLGHATLYALPALVIAAGWAETNFSGHTVEWFGVEMPKMFPQTGEGLQDLSADIHMWLAYGMLAVPQAMSRRPSGTAGSTVTTSFTA